MSLIKCTECGNSISDKSERCVHCGCPINVIKKQLGIENIEDSVKTNQNFIMLYDLIVKESDNPKKTLAWAKRICNVYGGDLNLISNSSCIPGNIIFSAFSFKSAKWISDVSEESGKCALEIRESYNTEESPISIRIIEMLKQKEYGEIFRQGLDRKRNDLIVSCPRCGSTSITTGQRGYSIIWGFIGSNKTTNRCAKCGYSWQP